MHDHSGGALKKWRQNFHIRRNHFGLGGTQIGVCCFCSFIKSLRDYGKKSILITNQQQFSIFSTNFFGLIFSCQTFLSISTKRFQIKNLSELKERAVGFLSTDETHKIVLDIHRMNKNVVKIQLKSI